MSEERQTSGLRTDLADHVGFRYAVRIEKFLSFNLKRPVEVETVLTAPDDPLAEYAVLPLATDVDIERAAGNSHDFLLGSEPLALAGEDDIQLEEAEPHPAWPGGAPKMTTAPGDLPMIFAARLR